MDTNRGYKHKTNYECNTKIAMKNRPPKPTQDTKDTTPLFNIYMNYSLQKNIQKAIKVIQKQGKSDINKTPIHTQTHHMLYRILQISHLRKKEKKNTTQKTNKTPILLNTKRKIPSYNYHNKKAILISGNIERNPGPKFTLLLNHPQIHQEKHNTYFYKNTTQIKIEYEHIFILCKPYLNHIHIENTDPHLKQFCINNQHYPHNHLFYAILIILAPTPIQCNQLISKKSTRWTSILLNKIINNPTALPT